MGLVIFSGISIGTFFTLFVVPAFYVLIARTIRGRVRKQAPCTLFPANKQGHAVPHPTG